MPIDTTITATPVAIPSVTPKAPPSAAAKGTEAKTAKSFEAVFLGQMTQMMMETVETDGPFGGGHGEEMFRGVLAEKLGTAIAAKGGIGLAPAVMAQIIKLQGGTTRD
ncbi:MULTISPECIES: rod-binding protein [unclassified Sphingomonas]|uniref:rod-binding protein n=1 Tax=unclassified Sphingomonas TaxID=196159 RepID=UPI0006FF0A50|nr:MULTISPECIES: rod-binding protein [unclassified Sphingomonas]KQS46938.1 flagellar biosynthesis protein FlgJ [Sphingomonas sp. Leaf198]